MHPPKQMPSEPTPDRTSAEWSEEQLRYRILKSVYERSGGDCERAITSTEVGAALDLRYEDLFRTVHFLEHQGLLGIREAGHQVCITPTGIHYIEELAGRRASIRTPPGVRPTTASG